jgi:hypothetical protein
MEKTDSKTCQKYSQHTFQIVPSCVSFHVPVQPQMKVSDVHSHTQCACATTNESE